MMQLHFTKQSLLSALLIVSGAIGKKQNNPILSHVLLEVMDDRLKCTATDLDIQISVMISCDTSTLAIDALRSITVPAKKWIDIMRSLEEDAAPQIQWTPDLFSIRDQRSLFKLAPLPAEDFPKMKEEETQFECLLPTKAFIRLLQSTSFALSQQDARSFLNSLYLEFNHTGLTAVGMDGHRMAVSALSMPIEHSMTLLIPRRSIQEILRLISPLEDEALTFLVSAHHITIKTEQYALTSKVVESRFPVYTKAIPRHHTKQLWVDKDRLKRALMRMIILAHEKSKAILLHLQPNMITLVANNQEKEEAIESLEAKTEGEGFKIGINASYLLDVLSIVNEGLVQLSFGDENSSILVQFPSEPGYLYVLMPMKL